MYQHIVYYLSDEYKDSIDFKKHMDNTYTNIKVSNFNHNNHSKVFGYIKTLELLNINEYDYNDSFIESFEGGVQPIMVNCKLEKIYCFSYENSFFNNTNI